MIAFATRLSDFLIVARRGGHSFEGAWIKAHRELRPDSEFPSCPEAPFCKHPPHMEERRLWELAYHRRGRGSAGMASLLAERVAAVDHVYVTPEPSRVRACGWDKHRDGCPEPARAGGWLCDAHRARVRVPAVSPLCTHPKCHENEEPNYALIVGGVVDDYCERHRKETDALELEAVAA